MKNHNHVRRSIARLTFAHTKDDRLRTYCAAVAEPCDRQPVVFPQIRIGTRSPWRPLFRYFRQAFDAARTPEQRHQVIERIVMFFLAGIAHVRVWLWTDGPDCRREVFVMAQHADSHEDMAETRFLLEPTRANAEALIDACRIARQRAEDRELYLVRVVLNDHPRDAA